jgi:hypothetical protein
MHGLERKLKGLSGALATWERETFGSIRNELKELRQLLTHLRSRPDKISPSHQELKVVERLVELQHRESCGSSGHAFNGLRKETGILSSSICVLVGGRKRT